mgnify:CR=1 FL=1
MGTKWEQKNKYTNIHFIFILSKMLSERQLTKLKVHAKGHKGGLNSKHMRDMKRYMLAGDTFAKAHKKALGKTSGRESKVPKKKSSVY